MKTFFIALIIAIVSTILATQDWSRDQSTGTIWKIISCLSIIATIYYGYTGLSSFLVKTHLLWILILLALICLIVVCYEVFLIIHDGKNTSYLKPHLLGLSIFLIAALAFGGWYHFAPQSVNGDTPNSGEAIGGYQQLDHKLNKHDAKEENDGAYYTDKTDKNIRYFTDNDGTITAIKYSYMPDPEHTTAVISEMDNLLDDSNLKYGNDKVDKDKTLLKGDNYNVYSPKHKKWYHMSMQKDDDSKVSTFSVWPGKVSNAE